jgi:hypothetical protein
MSSASTGLRRRSMGVNAKAYVFVCDRSYFDDDDGRHWRPKWPPNSLSCERDLIASVPPDQSCELQLEQDCDYH